MVVGISLKYDGIAVTLPILELYRRNHFLPINVHNVVKVVITASTSDDMWFDSAIIIESGDALVVVHVSSNEHILRAAGLSDCSSEDSLHVCAARVMIVC